MHFNKNEHTEYQILLNAFGNRKIKLFLLTF